VILVFGSINIDLVFAVETLPRPGGTELSPTYRVLPGGKGANQAVAAARAGARTAMVGAVGDDGFGRAARSALVENGVDASGVAIVSAPTGVAAVAVDRNGENAIVVGSGANLEVRANQVPGSLLSPDTVLVLQREVPIQESAALASRAKTAGARVILNLAPAGEIPRSLLEEIDILVLNEHEAAAFRTLIRSSVVDDGKLAARFGFTMIVTRGRDGVSAFTPNGEGMEIAALAIDPVDTTGAGDTFVGVLAAGLDCGRPFSEALHHATVGAGLACLARGAQNSMPKLKEIEARLAELSPPAMISR